MQYEEINKLVAKRNDLEVKLRKQIDEKLKMLMDVRYRSDHAYTLLAGKVLAYRTLKLWHTDETMKPSSYKKLIMLIVMKINKEHFLKEQWVVMIRNYFHLMMNQKAVLRELLRKVSRINLLNSLKFMRL